MKKMTIVAFTLLLAMGALAKKGGGSHNGKGGGIEARAKKSADWINEQVKLDSNQYKKLYTVQMESFKKLMVIKRDTSITKDVAKTQARQIKKSAVDQIKAILTPEQFQTLTAKLKEKRDARRDKQTEKKGKLKGVEKDIEDELLN